MVLGRFIIRGIGVYLVGFVVASAYYDDNQIDEYILYVIGIVLFFGIFDAILDFWLFSVLVDNEEKFRDKLLKRLNTDGWSIKYNNSKYISAAKVHYRISHHVYAIFDQNNAGFCAVFKLPIPLSIVDLYWIQSYIRALGNAT